MIHDPIQRPVAPASQLRPQLESRLVMTDEMRHPESPEPALEHLRLCARGIGKRCRIDLDYEFLQPLEHVIRLREREAQIRTSGLQACTDWQALEFSADQSRRRLEG